jgi:hypothetical protein
VLLCATAPSAPAAGIGATATKSAAMIDASRERNVLA